MSAEATDPVEGVFAVDEGDDVHLAVGSYEWASPYEVTDVDHVEWNGATGETWPTREVVVEGGYGSTFSVEAIDGDQELELCRHPGGKKRGDLVQFDPVDESGTSTEDDTTSESDSVSEAEEERVLEEEAADDAPADAGDDVQEEIVSEDVTVDGVDDDGKFECSCGETFETQQALQGHGPKSCGDDEDGGVDLPDGVTDDVDELTSGGITIGTLAAELGVHRNQARLIAFELGYYKRVREVFN